MNEKYLLPDVLNKSEIEYLINYFDSQTDYVETNGMKKYPVLSNPIDTEFIKFIDSIIVDKLGIKDYVILGDNFYEHSQSYFPHCDALQPNSWLNIVIPLEIYTKLRRSNPQSFIVFDQTYQNGNATWMGTLKLKGDFLSNKKIEIPMHETPGVEGLTGQPIDEELYQELEPKYLPKRELFGMSGTVFNWKPGDIIVFNSKYIHVTGRMSCTKKLGLSVRIGYKQ